MSQIDRPTPYRGPSDRLALVSEVVASDVPTLETDWLEVKRQADLRDKAWQGELATQILGFFNRDAARAARVVGGYAYIVVGAEPSRVRGVEQVDPAILEETIGRFVGRGEHAPTWEPFYVRIEEASVLVIVVDPPHAGAPPAPLRATYEAKGRRTVPEGRLFIRRGGQTVEASAAEVDQMFARSTAQGRKLAIDVVAAAAPIRVSAVDLSGASVQAWMETERARRLASGSQRLWPGVNMGLGTGEYRTREQYVKEVDDYVDKAGSEVAQHARYRAAATDIGALELVVVNRTLENYPRVVVQLDVPGPVQAYFDAEVLAPEKDLPEAPWPFGKPRSADAFMSTITFSRLNRRALRMTASLTLGEIDNSTPTRISFGPVGVRPDGRHRLDPVILIADPSLAGTEIETRWRATSSDVADVAEGSVTIGVADDVVSLADALALGDPRDE